MNYLYENSILSQRGSKSSPDIAMIGPRVEVPTRVKINNDGIDQSFEQLRKSSTSDSQEKQYMTSMAVSHTPTNRSFALRSFETKQQQKPTKKTLQHPPLKQVITQLKAKLIVQKFVKKIARNNTQSPPADYNPFFNEKQLTFLDQQGIQLNDFFEIFHFICCIFLIVSFTILSTLCLVLEEIETSTTFKVISRFCLLYFVFQVFLNLTTVKFQQGKKLSTLRQILDYNIRKNLFTDVLVVILLMIDQLVNSSHSEMTYLRLLIIFKLDQIFQKIQKLQVFFIRNFYYEQYWSLIKVFIFNFSLAHLLAIGLIGMASIKIQDSWMSRIDILDSPWYEKYAWAYYWATTIMLTVGFGDLNASNFEEAICLTFIEMISCIALGYNVNCVGMLINNIRAKDLQKSKNFKTFYKLSRKNQLSEDLEWRINNYIEESSNIKKQFNHEEENKFVQKLPQGLKTQFLKESNKKIFKNLPFFRHLTERTVFSFAQKIAMKVCHPEEVIQNLSDPHDLMILKGGQLSFTCKRRGCKYNETIIDQLKFLSHPILVSLGFIKNPRLNYEIKSLAYSILYFLDHESIMNILKTSQMDYEFYCLLKDKASNSPDDFQLFDCEICNQKHTKFTCPKLHFIPIKQHVINYHLYRVKHDKNPRTPSSRYDYSRYVSYNALQNYRSNLQPRNERAERNFFARILFRKTSRVSKRVILLKRYEEENDSSEPITKQISSIKDDFEKSTAELIKYEMTKVLHNGDCSDEVWLIETDKMKNYMYYFERDNSSNLIDKWINSVFFQQKIESLVRNDHSRTKQIFKIKEISHEDSIDFKKEKMRRKQQFGGFRSFQ